MCDVSYLCQVEALERLALAQIALLPHLEEEARKKMPTVDQVRAEFDEWLNEEPAEMSMTPPDRERLLMLQLLGVAK